MRHNAGHSIKHGNQELTTVSAEWIGTSVCIDLESRSDSAGQWCVSSRPILVQAQWILLLTCLQQACSKPEKKRKTILTPMTFFSFFLKIIRQQSYEIKFGLGINYQVNNQIMQKVYCNFSASLMIMRYLLDQCKDVLLFTLQICI